MSLPNVIIAGAPKCGTTSLYRYLSDHPEVCTSRFSETRYLIDRGKPFYTPDRNFHLQGLDGYRRLFQHCDPVRQRVILDVTPDYLYQKTPLQVLSGLDPVPKIIFILREPSRRTYSLYQFARNNIGLLEKKLSFKSFIRQIDASSDKTGEGRFILHDECEKSKYILYLKAYLDVFGPNGITINLYEELKSNPRQFMIDLCQKLHIDDGFYESYVFQIHNPGYTVRHRNLHRIRRKLRNRIPSNTLSAALSNLYHRINIRPRSNDITGEDIEVLRELASRFQPYNEELARTFNVDLKFWHN